MSYEENSGVFSRRKDYEQRVPVATLPLPKRVAKEEEQPKRRAAKKKSSQKKEQPKKRAAKEGGGKPRPYGKLCRDFFSDQLVPNFVVHSLLGDQKLVMNFFFAVRDQFPTIGSPQVAEHFPLNEPRSPRNHR